VLDVCRETPPELAPVSTSVDHLQRCYLDEETKDREAARLLAGTMAEAS
jgi:hypothetical protein